MRVHFNSEKFVLPDLRKRRVQVKTKISSLKNIAYED